MAETYDRRLSTVFDEIPELYDRARPTYPSELFDDFMQIGGLDATSAVVEVGSGTGQATRPLAGLVGSVTGVEPGPAMAALGRDRLAGLANVSIETSTFERWDDRGRRFDALVSASAWHWVDPRVGWRRAHQVIGIDGWLALLGHVIIRAPGEPEVYAETADLHERFSPGNPDWAHPPTAEQVLADSTGWGVDSDPGDLFEAPVVRWYPNRQTFDGTGFADLLRTLSPYRRLPADVREPLLDAVAERIRTRLDDRAERRYLAVLRMGRRRQPE